MNINGYYTSNKCRIVERISSPTSPRPYTSQQDPKYQDPKNTPKEPQTPKQRQSDSTHLGSKLNTMA